MTSVVAIKKKNAVFSTDYAEERIRLEPHVPVAIV